MSHCMEWKFISDPWITVYSLPNVLLYPQTTEWVLYLGLLLHTCNGISVAGIVSTLKSKWRKEMRFLAAKHMAHNIILFLSLLSW